MDRKTRKQIRTWAVLVIGDEEVERYYSLPFDDTGFGYDVFGYERECGLVAYALGLVLYKHYFRVESEGVDNVPGKGRLILASNRAGMVPVESLLTFADMVSTRMAPRFLRAVADSFLSKFPYMSLAFQRIGQINEHVRNKELVIEREEALLMFPEGSGGLTKPFRNRYKTASFETAFVELCLRLHAPVVPVAFVGSEEQSPILHNMENLAKKLHLPYFPLTPTFPWLGFIGALPLPVKFHMYYGEPIRFFDEYPAETVQYPNLIKQMADVVQERIQGMIDKGLENRSGIFV